MEWWGTQLCRKLICHSDLKKLDSLIVCVKEYIFLIPKYTKIKKRVAANMKSLAIYMVAPVTYPPLFSSSTNLFNLPLKLIYITLTKQMLHCSIYLPPYFFFSSLSNGSNFASTTKIKYEKKSCLDDMRKVKNKAYQRSPGYTLAGWGHPCGWRASVSSSLAQQCGTLQRYQYWALSWGGT